MMESGRNRMRGCPDNRVDMSLSRDIRLGGNRTFEFRLDVFNLFDTVIYDQRNSTINYVSPTDLTVRNSQTLADGSIDPARLVPRNAGFGAATQRAAAAQHAAPVPVRVLDQSGGLRPPDPAHRSSRGPALACAGEKFCTLGSELSPSASGAGSRRSLAREVPIRIGSWSSPAPDFRFAGNLFTARLAFCVQRLAPGASKLVTQDGPEARLRMQFALGFARGGLRPHGARIPASEVPLFRSTPVGLRLDGARSRTPVRTAGVPARSRGEPAAQRRQGPARAAGRSGGQRPRMKLYQSGIARRNRCVVPGMQSSPR